jgi:lantibiotic modifying enzyme
MFTLDNQPVPAFSRGASGIALALGRLYKVTGRSEYRQAAREALWCENNILQEKEYAWPGLNGQKPETKLSWSTGAAGICLNRLEAGDIIGFEQRDSDLQAALELLRCAGGLSRDNLSWGNFGLIDVLVAASCRLDDAELYSEALKRAARHVEDFNGTIPELSFFNGISGIGYVLLRLVDRRLPSVLAFE